MNASPADLLEDPPIVASSNIGRRFLSRSVRWSGAAPLEFLRGFTGQPRALWQSDGPSPAFASAGVAAVLTASGPERLASIRAQSDRLFSEISQTSTDAPSQIKPRLFGGLAYAPDFEPDDIWSAFAPAVFILPAYQLTRLGEAAWLTVNQPIEPGQLIEEAHAQLDQTIDDLQARLSITSQLENHPQRPAPWNIEDLTQYPIWERMVNEVTARIYTGQLSKVVLARSRRARAKSPIDPVAVLAQLDANYPHCYRFLMEPFPGHAFLGATPELLAEVSGNCFRTMALAGSIRRGATPTADAALGAELLANSKEHQEHVLVREAMTESLELLAEELNVSLEPQLYPLPNIQHLCTPISGKLVPGCDVLHVVEALHPTPAVGGTPREAALKLIPQLEPHPRGWYAGPVGWLDSQGDGVFAVALRSAVVVGEEARLYAGAGIVADSDPRREWQETELKFKPMLNALKGASR